MKESEGLGGVDFGNTLQNEKRGDRGLGGVKLQEMNLSWQLLSKKIWGGYGKYIYFFHSPITFSAGKGEGDVRVEGK